MINPSRFDVEKKKKKKIMKIVKLFTLYANAIEIITMKLGWNQEIIPYTIFQKIIEFGNL